MLLLGGLIVVTVTDIQASLAIDKRNWPKAKEWTGISLGVSVAVVFLSLFLLVKSKGGNPEQDAFIGVNLAYIIALLAMIGIAIMNIFAMINIDSEGRKMSSWSAATGAVSFVLCVAIIVLAM